jgi:small conductance mechanosensitive channel
MVEHMLAKTQELIVLYGLKVISAVLILTLGRFAANILKKVIEGIMVRTKVDVTLVSFVCSLFYVSLMAFVIIAALEQLGIQTTSFIAILGAAGLAVGLALQGSLSNFAAGVLMIIFKPFKVGDTVEGGGASGVVEKIEIFTTTLRSPDKKTIIVPNSKIGGGSIVNYNTMGQTRLIDLPVGFNYKDDFEKIEKNILEILAGDDRIINDPAPAVGIAKFTETHVIFSVKAWTSTVDYDSVSGRIMIKIKELFDNKTVLPPLS